MVQFRQRIRAPRRRARNRFFPDGGKNRDRILLYCRWNGGRRTRSVPRPRSPVGPQGSLDAVTTRHGRGPRDILLCLYSTRLDHSSSRPRYMSPGITRKWSRRSTVRQKDSVARAPEEEQRPALELSNLRESITAENNAATSRASTMVVDEAPAIGQAFREHWYAKSARCAGGVGRRRKMLNDCTPSSIVCTESSDSVHDRDGIIPATDLDARCDGRVYDRGGADNDESLLKCFKPGWCGRAVGLYNLSSSLTAA